MPKPENAYSEPAYMSNQYFSISNLLKVVYIERDLGCIKFYDNNSYKHSDLVVNRFRTRSSGARI